ncbi:SAM-dependent methyltransferase [Amycolatopsis alkalitolerans]|uniref:S-adenosyl-L-methionine-dependent methyltransferase n=1 Tax=Amycolatopsis alkalitolerans TaxID=2547244 RepID=A0A5C4LT71_9PSEU|nr:SAM-dependent methyltransferase [Amycolatopsis alkalitolerans]TNC21798.1 class I SAM-dependent methyltransferase [Amycolatopsis alkalitolerans]
MKSRNPAARTAFGPMFVTAIEQYTPAGHRIVDEPSAGSMLPSGLRLAARAGRWRRVREWLPGASDRSAPGVWAGVLCRKRYARDQVRAAVADGIGQVVVLGAGLDTLAYRLTVPAFEVDMPENIAYKRRRVEETFGTAAGVRLVAHNFDTQDLADSLAAQGFRPELPTMFVWEAVTQYLTGAGLRRTLAFLATAAAGSRLIFTFVRQDFADGTRFYGAESLHRRFVERERIWHTAFDPVEVDGLLREYGWAEREQVGPAEYADRYLRPAGRDLSASEIERFVLAEKR